MKGTSTTALLASGVSRGRSKGLDEARMVFAVLNSALERIALVLKSVLRAVSNLSSK